LGIGRAPWIVRVSSLLLAALLLTAVFDLITNLSTALLYGLLPAGASSADTAARLRAFRIVLLGGLPFAIVHLGVNAALFVAAGAPLAGVLARSRARLSL